MADINSSTFSETDASNTSLSPYPGFPENMSPSVVNDSLRAFQGAVKRSWNRINATVLTTGASGTYTYAPISSSFPTSYINGEIFTFRAHQDSVGNDVINVNALGAKNLYVFVNTGIIQIQAHQIKSGQIVQAMYDSTLNTGVGGFQVLGALPRSLSPGDGTGSWTAGSVAFAAGINSLTQDNANFFYDSTLHLLGIGKIPTAGHVLDMRGLTTAGDNGVKLQAFQASYQVLNNAANTNYYFGVDDADASKLKIGGGSGPNQGVQPAITVSGGGVPLVGINNTAPGFKLDVTGDINTSTTYKIGGTQIAASSLSNGTTGTGAVMLAASPTSTGTLTGAAITATGTLTGATINATTQYNIAGGAFAINEGGYNKLIDTGPGGAIYLGKTGDAQNYYRQTTHTIQGIGGVTTFSTISAAGVVVNTGNMTVNAGNSNISGVYQIGGTQITTGALSDYSTGTWTPSDGSGAGLAFTTSDANYVKIGKVVTCSGRITWPANGSGATAQIAGFPFAAKSGSTAVAGGTVATVNGAGITSMVWFALTQNSTTTGPLQGSSAGNWFNSGLAGITITFTITYITN